MRVKDEIEASERANDSIFKKKQQQKLNASERTLFIRLPRAPTANEIWVFHQTNLLSQQRRSLEQQQQQNFSPLSLPLSEIFFDAASDATADDAGESINSTSSHPPSSYKESREQKNIENSAVNIIKKTTI